MSRIDEFRKANPQYNILDVTDSAFTEYGVIHHREDLHEVDEIMSKYPVPEEGMKYIASIPELEKCRAIMGIRRDIFGEIPIDAGVTLGHADDFTAFEYHQCSEVNIMMDDVVIVLGKRQTLETYGSIDPNREAKMFYVPKNTVIELYNDTLHYAPIQVTKDGYKVIVIVIHGTNAVLPKGMKSLNPRVVKKGKFQVVHPCRKDKIAQGYKVGLTGDVIKTKPLDK